MKKGFILCLIITILSIVACSNKTSEVKENENLESEEGNQVTNVVIEESKPLPVGKLTFIHRASVRIDLLDGRVIYIDPYAGYKPEYEKEADLVLVTHQHTDHNKVSLITLKESGKVVQCPSDIKSGESLTFDDIKVTAVEAYNNNHLKDQCCGFIIEIGDLVIYHSGDTSLIDEMATFKDFNIDYALLCMDDYYNMGPDEAAQVASLIEAKHVIPIHTDKNGGYNEENAGKFTYESVIILGPSDDVDLIDAHR